MTKSVVVFSGKEDSIQAGNDLGKQITTDLKSPPDVIIIFGSSSYDFEKLLKAVKKSCNSKIIVGSSSAGEFTSEQFSTDSVCAVAIKSEDIQFNAGIAKGISGGRQQVADELSKALKGNSDFKFRYHSAMIFADALSGYTDELIDMLTEKTGGIYQFFGGGAGDNANFKKTFVFYGDKVYSDAAVILEILSQKPVGIGVSHGWQPVGDKMKATEVDGMKLISLNAMPAVEAIEEFAEKTGQSFDKENPIPFFLHNVLGVEVSGGYKLRVPLVVLEDGSVILASDIPKGATVKFMSTDVGSSKDAAFKAANSALSQLEGNKPSVALFFDCVATRLRMGNDFGFELEQVKTAMKEVSYAGCNTYGQVARVDGQFSGFHNCTAVVCVIPE